MPDFIEHEIHGHKWNVMRIPTGVLAVSHDLDITLEARDMDDLVSMIEEVIAEEAAYQNEK
jgi:hypothetical protein